MFSFGGLGGIITFIIFLRIWINGEFVMKKNGKIRLYAVFMRVQDGIGTDGLMAAFTSLEDAKKFVGRNAYHITSFDTDTEYPNGVKNHVINKLLGK